MQTHKAKRVEIIIEAPMEGRLTSALEKAGVVLVLAVWVVNRSPAINWIAWALAAPVLILGGLRTGWFTPTEAAVMAVFYGLVVGFFIYRTLTLRDIHELLIESAETSAVILIVVVGPKDLPPMIRAFGKMTKRLRQTADAIGEFLREAAMKPWFRNTVFVIVADHQASAGGKTWRPSTSCASSMRSPTASTPAPS